jgi:hypothetical protein
MPELSRRATEIELTMIEECENNSEHLSDWELKFIDNISRCTILSMRQAQVLEQIWNKLQK